MLTRKKSVGTLVRVKREVESLVRLVSEETGYSRFTIRNLAILYGLLHLVLPPRLPRDDPEFLEFYARVRKLISEVVSGA